MRMSKTLGRLVLDLEVGDSPGKPQVPPKPKPARGALSWNYLFFMNMSLCIYSNILNI